MSKSYRSAKMHEGTFAVGFGAVNKELSTSGDSINKAVESITLKDGSNLVTVVLKDKVGKPVTLDIPLSNFENLRE